MSVALIAHYLGPQLGIGQYLDRLVPPLVRKLQESGTVVSVLASPNAIKNTPSFSQFGTTLKILPQLDNSPTKRYAWFVAQFSNYCRKHNIESVTWLSNPLVLPWHPPSLAVIHDVNEWKNDNKGLLRTRLRSLVYLDASLKFAQTIVAVSKATEKDIQYFRPGINKAGKLKIIVNGSDSDLINLPAINVPAPEAPFMLSVGRIDPKGKCLPEAVVLVESLRKVSGDAWELHLVGGMNQSTEDSGRAFLRSINELPWVQYHGHVENQALAEWYRRASAVIFLAEHEGFGLPIAEAVSFGRIVVISNLNDAGLEAGGSGVIAIDIHNPKAGAEEFLRRLNGVPVGAGNHLEKLPTWKSAASKYAHLVNELARLKNRETTSRDT